MKRNVTTGARPVAHNSLAFTAYPYTGTLLGQRCNGRAMHALVRLLLLKFETHGIYLSQEVQR